MLPLLGDVETAATQTYEGRRPQGTVETGLGWIPGLLVILPHLLGQEPGLLPKRSAPDTPSAGVVKF